VIEKYKSMYHNLHDYKLEKNYGYACANNHVIPLINTEYTLLLNNDTIVTENWLNELISILDTDKTVGAVGAKLLFPDNTIQHAGVAIINDNAYGDNLVARHFNYKLDSNNPNVNKLIEFQALTAACLLIRTSLFENLEGFDENFYNGYEDVDLCFRIKELNYKLVYNPKSVVYHLESQSGSERFVKTKQNIKLLHSKWMSKIIPDYIISVDGTITQNNNVIKEYRAKSNVTKLTSIILVAYNQYQFTRETIESIFEHTKEPFELILVDNNSDKYIKWYFNLLNESCDNVKVITNNENVGFPKAVNQALALCSGDYICIANNDILVTENWLSDMITHLESDEQNGLCGPVSNNVTGPQKIPTNYKNIDEMYQFAKNMREKHLGNKAEFGRLVFFHVLIKKAVFDKIGGLDEIFTPGNFEDDDFCIRAKLAGFKAHILYYVFIHHYGSKSFTVNGSEAYNKLLATNKQKFFQKWGLTVEQLFLENKLPENKEIFIKIGNE
jgi:GT2 family glycosyltransferase